MMDLSFSDFERLGYGEDPRVTPAREDLAASHLKGRVEVARFVCGREGIVVLSRAPLRENPDAGARLLTEILFGERFDIYELRKGWVWGQALLDGYVGYLPAAAVSPGTEKVTHRVAMPLTHAYPEPDLKIPPRISLPMSARLSALPATGDTGFRQIAGAGWVWARHMAPLDRPAADFVNTALGFLGAPYLWGGKTIAGMDCSGLIQLSLAMAGLPIPRDADMQARAIGDAVNENAAPGPPGDLRRGDIVFFPAHVGIMLDEARLLHANATNMMVTIDPLEEVVAIIGKNHDQPVTGVRRLPDG